MNAFSEIQETIIKDRFVLVSLWQDSNKVGLCSTIHDSTEWANRNRKRPKGTSTLASITKKPFLMFNPPIGCKEPYEHTRELPIPMAIDDYNQFMGGVDIANQLRAGFSTQQRGIKPWRPLFYWLLDSTITNAFTLSEHERKGKLGGKVDSVHSAHWAFREGLVSNLLEDLKAIPKLAFVTKSTMLPQIRHTTPIEIH